MRHIDRNLGILAAALFSIAAPAVAAEDPLEAIPDDAGLVIRWQKPTETVRKAVEFATRVDGDYGAQAQQLSLGIGLAISNPGLTGVDAKRDWYVAVYPVVDDQPGIVFAIPAADADAMKEAITGDFNFVAYEDWLLYTDKEELAGRLQDRIEGKQQSIATKIDKESAAVMDRGDLSIYLNVVQLRKTYRESLDAARDEFEASMAQMQNFGAAAGGPGINFQPIIGMYTKMFRGMLQTVEDTAGVAAAVTVGKEDVALEALARVTADSPTDTILQANRPAEMKRLKHLPSGAHAYLVASGDVQQFLTWAWTLSATMFAGKPEVKAAMDEAQRETAKLEFGSVLWSLRIGDSDRGLFRIAGVTEVKPTDKMRDVSRKVTRSMGKLELGPVTQEIELRPDAEKYGEQSADLVITRQHIDPQLDPTGDLEEMQRTLYGEEGNVQRIVYRDDVVAQTMGGGRAAMEALLKSLAAREQEVADAENKDQQALAAARAQLSAKANVVAIADLPAIVAGYMRMIVQMLPFPIGVDVDALQKDLGEERSYAGLSLAGEPQAVRLKVHVPLKQAQNVVKLKRTFDKLDQIEAQPAF